VAGALGEAAARVWAVGRGGAEAAGGRIPGRVSGLGRSHMVMDMTYDRERVRT
jgi:hypothetical protein